MTPLEESRREYRNRVREIIEKCPDHELTKRQLAVALHKQDGYKLTWHYRRLARIDLRDFGYEQIPFRELFK